jgi:sodium/bile acid cotransporter 7
VCALPPYDVMRAVRHAAAASSVLRSLAARRITAAPPLCASFGSGASAPAPPPRPPPPSPLPPPPPPPLHEVRSAPPPPPAARSQSQLPPSPPLPQPVSPLSPSPPAAAASPWARLQSFLLAQHLILGLAAAVACGWYWPAPGLAASATPLAPLSLVGIFFLTGLGLDARAVSALRGRRAAAVLGVGLATILLASPAAALALAQLPLGALPAEFAQGLALFWAMPTTTSSGVLIVGEAGGAVATALGLSVLSNVAAVFTAPLFVAGLLAAGAGGVALGAGDLLARLALTVLAPLAAGQAARAWPPAAAAAARHRTAFRLASSALLIAVPWMLMSSSSATLHATPAAHLAALVGLCAAAHAALLAANVALAAALPAAAATPPERVAIAVMGAQKTINLAAAIVLALPAGAGVDPGLLILPCLVSHFIQTLVDSLFGTAAGKRLLHAAWGADAHKGGADEGAGEGAPEAAAASARRRDANGGGGA